MRPLASVAGTRCTRWTPLSYLSRLYTRVPSIRATTSLMAPTPLSLIDRTSTFQRCPSAKRLYIRNRSPANRPASSPPVPARISSTTFFSSFGSFGTIRTRISASRSSRRASSSASSCSASSRSSASGPPASSRVSAISDSTVL